MDNNYTAEHILQLYNQLQFGKTRDIKNQANFQILQFIETTQAWQVANQLLSSDRPGQDQFIGAQVIFKKIESHFDQIEVKDALVVEVRNALFSFIPNHYGNKLVLDRICMAVSLLALKTINTCWMNSIDDIISQGQQSPESCFVSLILLKNITQMYQTQINDRKNKQIAENFFRQNLSKVLDFISMVLEQQNLPRDCYVESLRAAKQWCMFSTKTLVPNQKFISTIFNLMNTEMFSKSVNIITKLLTRSQFTKALSNQKLQDAINMVGMSDQDKQFLEQTVLTLKNLQPKFLQHPLCLQFDDDSEDQFPQKYINLTVCLCSNYEILMVQNNALQEILFGLIKDCAKVPNLRLAISSLEFWNDFKETIYTHNFDNQPHIIQQYKDIAHIVLQQSLKIDSIPYEKLHVEEIEELEVQEKGVSTARFREYTSEILLTLYLMLQRNFKSQGEQVVYDIILSGLHNSQNPFELEVCLFGAQSIYDGFNDDPYNEPTLNFINQIFQFISQKCSKNYVLARQGLQCTYDMSKILKEVKQCIYPTVEFCLVQVQKPSLTGLAVKAMYEICLFCKCQFSDNEITPLYNFLQQNYNNLQTEHAAKLVEAAGQVASVLEDQKMKIAVFEISKIPKMLIACQNVNDVEKGMNCLNGLVKALEDLPSFSLKDTLQPLFFEVWPLCKQFYQNQWQHVNLIETTSDYVLRSMKCCDLNLIFSEIQSCLLNTFLQNSACFQTLQVYAKICSLVSKQENLKQEIVQSSGQVINALLQRCVKPQSKSFADGVDTDVMTQFALYLMKVVEIQPEALVECPQFNQVIDVMCNTLMFVNQMQLIEQVVQFIMTLTGSVSTKIKLQQSKLAVIQQYDKLVPALIATVPSDKSNSVSINRVSQALIHVLSHASALGSIEQFRTLIVQSFKTNRMLQGVTDRTRNLIADIIIVFHNELMKIRLTLQNLNWLANGQVGEDAFLGLELQARDKVKQRQLCDEVIQL